MKSVLTTLMFAGGLFVTSAAFADAIESGQGQAPAPGRDQTNMTDSLQKGDIPEKYKILPLLEGQPQSVDGHELANAKVLDKHGKAVGKLEDVIVDSASGKIAYVVVLLDENGCELANLPGPAEWNTPDGENVIKALLGA